MSIKESSIVNDQIQNSKFLFEENFITLIDKIKFL